MFHNRLTAAVVVGALALAGAALAEDKLSKGDKEWMEKEVGPIITAQEAATFQEINKDDRKLFKELFWMRRDYNPMTPENEFQKEYEARVKAADENFKGRGQKGSETDMGQIFILLGAPNQQQRGARQGGNDTSAPSAPTSPRDPGDDSPGVQAPGGGFGSGSDSQIVTWVYDPNPDIGIPNGLEIQFRQQAQFGFRLVSNDDVTKQLERVKERLVSNPSVNYTRDEKGRLRKPDARFDPNSPAKLALKSLQETGQTSDGIAFDVKPTFFEASAGQIYIPLDFTIDSGLNDSKGTVFGAVENSDGFTVYQFEEEAEMKKDAAGKQVWEMPLQLQPGMYTLYVGVMDQNNTVQGTKVMDLDVPDLAAGDLTLSSILMFVEGNKVNEAMGSPGRAFLFGGYHFTPKREMVYTKKDQLSGVFYAYNYGLEGDKPNLTVQVSFYKDSERRGSTKDEPFMLQSPEMALTIFDIPLNIPNFKDPGNYRVEVKVTDHVSGKTVTKEIPFEIQGD